MPTRKRLLERYSVRDRTFTRWCLKAGIEDKEIPRGRRVASDKVFQKLEEIWIATRVCHIGVDICLEKFAQGYTLKRLIKERHPKRTLLEHLRLAIAAHPEPGMQDHPVVVHQLEQLEATKYEPEPDTEPEPEIYTTGVGTSYQSPTPSSQGSVAWADRISGIL